MVLLVVEVVVEVTMVVEEVCEKYILFLLYALCASIVVIYLDQEDTKT